VIYWITGRRHSGKTTLAYRLAAQTNGIVIDGDEVRKIFPTGFSDDDRYNNIMLIAKIAKLFENQGRTVVVACVSPKRHWRKEAQEMFDECLEICLPFGELWEGTEFEEPEE
jgi:adenylylsulfate kinase-like enzyme